MTEIKDLSITSATFTVKVLRVDNHKMTKATFRQIREKEIILGSWPHREYILGYVMDGNIPWLMYMSNKLLWKCSVQEWRFKMNAPDKKTEWGRQCFEDYDQLFIAT